MAALRTALVGCGPMAGWHTSAVDALDEFDLIALCDISEENARALAGKTGVDAVYTDFAAMLSEQSAQAARRRHLPQGLERLLLDPQGGAHLARLPCRRAAVLEGVE